MERALEPISAARLAGLAIVVALGATVAVVGLALSDPGDDAERISYVVSLLAAAATAVLLVFLRDRRLAQVVTLRGEAAVVVFELRVAAMSVRSGPLDPGQLRATTELATRARELSEILTRAGIDGETLELQVGLEGLEMALAVREATAL